MSQSPSLDRNGRTPSAAMLRAKKSQKKGLKFTIMLCGPSGCGKSTFINTLCGREVISSLNQPPVEFKENPGLEIVPIVEDLPDERNGVLSIKFIDTPGFGDNLDNTQCFKELSKYIEEQFDQVLAEESRIKRNPKFTDNRVHALIYFIIPTGHGLREADVEFMKLMSTKVNVIPVISKADSLTIDELQLNKKLIMEDIEHYNIPIYNFPSDSDSDEESQEQNSSLRSLMPFAVVGGTQLMKIKGKSTLVRQYPWGVVDITDPKISDISILSEILLQTHLTDLKDTTHDFLYENYRTDKLSHERENSGSVDIKTSNASQHSNGYRSTSASYVLREEQLRLEEDKLKSIEQRVQEEIAKKRQDLIQREEELRQLEQRLQNEAKQIQMSKV